MSASIKDVAEAAGVSATTVSHVLSGRGRVADQTRERVARIAKELDYRPNVHAQQLVTRKSRTIGIQVGSYTEAASKGALIPWSDYFLDLLNGAAAAAAARGYALILMPPALEPASMDEFAVDGVIVVDPRGDEPLFTDGWHRRKPVVTTGRPTTGERVSAVVDNDHRGAATHMLDHLEAQGYRQPALIITSASRSYIVDMLGAYRAWIASRGLTECIALVGETPSPGAAADALRDLLSRTPTPDAFLASSEELALGILQEAQGRGLAVPDDVAVCSAVDSSLLQLTTPQVTGTYLNPNDIGVRAVDLLLQLAENPDSRPEPVPIPTYLCSRASTLRVAAEPAAGRQSGAHTDVPRSVSKQ